MPRHMLSDRDFVARTAVCSVCGPVRLRKAGPNWRCWEVSRKAHNRSKIMTRYRITWAQWSQLLIEQSGRCAICCEPMLSPQVDHDHVTGEVRGLLCDHCNRGLGCFRDDLDTLLEAVAYLRK